MDLTNYMKPRILVCLNIKTDDLVSYLNTCNFEVISVQYPKIHKALSYSKYDFCIFGNGTTAEESAFELIKAARAIKPDVPIIYVGECYNIAECAEAYRLGVDDYVVVPFNGDELAYRIKAIIRRAKIQLTSPDSLYQIGRFEFDTTEETLVDVKDELPVVNLRHKEAVVLSTLCMYMNETVSRETLLAYMWGEDTYYTQRILDTYVSYLRKYLMPDPSVKIETLRQSGYRLRTKQELPAIS